MMNPLEHVRATVCTSVCSFQVHIDRLAQPNKKSRKKN
ncbi:hypothetical protein BSU04_06620 [Caballeronia sordidicola]|uniref:Uncharacterized protein n=1 Tax=Caballeronia sordidicola TaxID=196367 RepID=A0A226X7L2_CABSO|nr:hypothetical protein BSU04_06620 [Caballeronia sordidicola]